MNVRATGDATGVAEMAVCGATAFAGAYFFSPLVDWLNSVLIEWGWDEESWWLAAIGYIFWLLRILALELELIPQLSSLLHRRRMSVRYKLHEISALLARAVFRLLFPLLVFGAAYGIGQRFLPLRFSLLAGLVSSFASHAFVSELLALSESPEELEVERGTRWTTLKPLQQRLPAPTLESPYFGGVELPESEVLGNFLYLGKTGSGKSLSIEMLMRSLLSGMEVQGDRRALVYNHKGDTVALLKGMGVSYQIFDPFDCRAESVAWDIAADCTNLGLAKQFSKLLISDEKEQQTKFFISASRDILAGVLFHFVERRKASDKTWDLLDVCSVLRSPERLKAILGQSSFGRDLIRSYLEEARSAGDVLATLRTYAVNELEPLASAWRYLREKNGAISLNDWLNGQFVLVLGSASLYKTVMETMNRLVFRRLVDLVKDLPDSTSRRIYFILDEAIEIGKLEGLDDLSIFGRSKGSVLVFGFQSISGMQQIYGEKVTSKILEQIHHFALLKCGKDSAKWASELIGQHEIFEYRRTIARGERGASVNVGEQLATRAAVLPEDMMQLPKPTLERGLSGYYYSSVVDKVWKAEIPAAEVERRRPRPDRRELAKVPTPEEYLTPNYYSEPPVEEPESSQPLKIPRKRQSPPMKPSGGVEPQTEAVSFQLRWNQIRSKRGL